MIQDTDTIKALQSKRNLDLRRLAVPGLADEQHDRAIDHRPSVSPTTDLQ